MSLRAEHDLFTGIGRVAQYHVRLDNAIRSVFRTLTSPSPAVFLANRTSSTSLLVEECRLMLRKSRVPDDVIEGGTLALDAAMRANVLRNEVVHDMWIREEGDVNAAGMPQWRTHRRKAGEVHMTPIDVPRDLGFLDDAQTAMLRAIWRVSALDWALWATLPAFQGAMPGALPKELARNLAMMRDDFVLNEDGSARVQV